MNWIWFTGIVIGSWALLRLIGNERQMQLNAMEHNLRIQKQLAEMSQHGQSPSTQPPPAKQPQRPVPISTSAKPAAKPPAAAPTKKR